MFKEHGSDLIAATAIVLLVAIVAFSILAWHAIDVSTNRMWLAKADSSDSAEKYVIRTYANFECELYGTNGGRWTVLCTAPE
jgi:hypothetical protein